jgi:hypothetical protein
VRSVAGEPEQLVDGALQPVDLVEGGDDGGAQAGLGEVRSWWEASALKARSRSRTTPRRAAVAFSDPATVSISATPLGGTWTEKSPPPSRPAAVLSASRGRLSRRACQTATAAARPIAATPRPASSSQARRTRPSTVDWGSDERTAPTTCSCEPTGTAATTSAPAAAEATCPPSAARVTASAAAGPGPDSRLPSPA